MVSAPALAGFLEARSAEAGRAFVRMHGVGAAGTAACRRLTDVLDDALRTLAAPLGDRGAAVVAVGGYGRREMARHSDIDVMLLVASEPGTAAINAVLYPLWDASLKVGHAVRTVEQVVAAGDERPETLTALLDARLIAGDRTLWEQFERARHRLARKRQAWLGAELRAAFEARVQQEPWQLQELDLKNGRGGLRDIQTIGWLNSVDAFAADEDVLHDITLDPPVRDARELLLTTRNVLHWLEDRPNDRFRRDLTPAVAEWLAVDRHAWERQVLNATRTIDHAVRERLSTITDAPRRRWFGGLLRRPSAITLPTRGDAIDSDASPTPDADLNALRAAVREAVTSPALEPLPRAPWLERVLPEWEALRGLPHVAPFHQHPVDTHALRAVAEALYAVEHDDDATGTPEAAARHGDIDELVLATLLHDIGKGHEEDHSLAGAVIAERFAARVGMDAERAQRLTLAVRHHLLLPSVATRRDIADPRVIHETAEIIGDARALHLLYLISIADGRATGPDVWNAWRAQLLQGLYMRVLDVLTAETGAASATERRRQAVEAALADRYAAQRVQQHLDALPPSYVLSTPAETIAEHLDLLAAAEHAPERTTVHHERVGDVERLTIVTPDRPGILSQVAGVLAVHNVSVLGGVAYTREDGMAIDVMHVGDGLGVGIDERRWERISAALPEGLAGRFPIDARLAETRAAYAGRLTLGAAPIQPTVHVDNLGSEAYSIVEVTAEDRIGLLYDITTALRGLALDIHLAKVDTLGREVVDAFYVRRENGRRVDELDEIERLRERVLEAIAPPRRAP